MSGLPLPWQPVDLWSMRLQPRPSRFLPIPTVTGSASALPLVADLAAEHTYN
jgi:hypothetical protein